MSRPAAEPGDARAPAGRPGGARAKGGHPGGARTRGGRARARQRGASARARGGRERLAVFAYGSLADPASASETLGRPVRVAALARLAGWRRTWGVARDNLSTEKTFARPDGSLPRYCLGLNLEPAREAARTSDPAADPARTSDPTPSPPSVPTSSAYGTVLDARRERGAPDAAGTAADWIASASNGALIAVDEADLDRLDLRELRYRRAEVTAALRTGADDGPRFDRVFAYTARPEHHHPEPPEDAIVIASYLRAVEAAFAALGPAELETFRATTAPPRAELVEAVLVRDRIPAGNPREW